MKTTDRKQLYKLMAILAEEYTEGKSISKLKAELWFNELKMYPIEAIEQAIKKIIRTRTVNNYPKISEVIKEIEGTQEDKIIEKWLLVKETITKIGAYQTVSFEDHVINSIIDEMGGWDNVCTVNINDLKWMQKDFEKLYPILAKRNTHPKVLLGVADQVNRTNSRPIIIKNKKSKLQLSYEKI